MVVVLISPPIPPSTQHPPLPQAIPPPIVPVHVSWVGSLATPFPMLYVTSLWLFCNYLFVILNPLASSPIPTHLVTIKMLWDPGSGAWRGAGSPHSRYPSWIFIHHMGIRLICISAPATSLDGCEFFNPVVVELPFYSILDGSEWWMFYILVVILMWLCEEALHVYLCNHLDWKFQKMHFNIWSFYILKYILVYISITLCICFIVTKLIRETGFS